MTTQSKRGCLNKQDGQKIGRSVAIAFGAAGLVLVAHKLFPDLLNKAEAGAVLGACLAVLLNGARLWMKGN